MVQVETISSDDQSELRRTIPLLAKIAGAKDERTFNSDEVGYKGRRALVKSGVAKVLLPSLLAAAISFVGFQVMGGGGLCFGPLFLIANVWIQSITNPLISERRAQGFRTGFPALCAFLLLLVSGTFAATLAAWYLFKTTVDQQHMDSVARVMLVSQEKSNLTFAEQALEKERASILGKKDVSTTAIDRATKSFAQAQDLTAKANAVYQEEVSKGQGGRKPGDGRAAKALWQALQDAKAAEAGAKTALDEARAQAAILPEESQHLVVAYSAAKGSYEAKEKALIEAGPGLLKTFWWLIGMLHTEPMLIVFLLVWTTLEASSVISHSFAGINSYERARYTTIQEDVGRARESRRLLREQVKELAVHKAEITAAKRASRALSLEARDRSKG